MKPTLKNRNLGRDCLRLARLLANFPDRLVAPPLGACRQQKVQVVTSSVAIQDLYLRQLKVSVQPEDPIAPNWIVLLYEKKTITSK